MQEVFKKLEHQLKRGNDYLLLCSELDLIFKPTPDKWSKKEILGHLIDSAINNLQRFTEIQYADKPYQIRPYNQNELVLANDYHNADLQELLRFWLAINHRIIAIINRQSAKSLNYQIEIYEKEIKDLRFLMTDYVDHLEHHLNQIVVKIDS